MPKLDSLNARIQADISTRIQGVSPTQRRSILGAIGRALAGACQGLYGYIDRKADDASPYTATGKALEGWASLWLKGGRKQPTTSTGSVLVIGAQGKLLPALTVLQSATGVTYTTDADSTLDDTGQATVSITAAEAGMGGNAAAGATLTFVSPLDGIAASCTVGAEGLTGGTDLESDDGLRERMIQRIQNPPQGGSDADYVAWALEVAGITRAWTFPTYNGPGTVRVYVADDTYSGATLAAASEVAAAQAYLDSVKPNGVAYLVGGVVTNGLEVIAPTAAPVDFTIALGASVNTSDVQDKVLANLQAVYFREAEPEGTVRFHHLLRAISEAVGDGDYTLTTPTADMAAAAGEILTLGAITWA